MTLRIALLGAECTGKSTLTEWLGQALADHQVGTVAEYLREWCLRVGRTPLNLQEQAHIAAEQTRRIHAAGARHPVVVADTTALMTAVYSRHYFQDAAALPEALEAQRRFDLTLLCCPDGIPWAADGQLRESPSVRADTHAELVQLLHQHDLPYVLLDGPLTDRQARAEAQIRALVNATSTRAPAALR